MKNSKDLLSSTLKTAQMGQTGIRAVLPYARDPVLRNVLSSQLREYGAIEQEAQHLGCRHGIETVSLSPALRPMVRMTAALRLHGKNRDSRIAAMTMRGNAAGLIKSMKNRNHYDHSDGEVYTLSGRLLQAERDNMEEMQRFL